MTDQRTPAQCAEDVVAARDRLVAFAQACSEADWRSSPLGEGDPRSVGVVTDHVAHSYEYIGSWIGTLLKGTAPKINPAVIDELNAQHASRAGQVTIDEAVAHLRQSGDTFAGILRSLRPNDFETHDGRICRLAEVAIRHTDGHRSEIEHALVESSAKQTRR
jgi:hypothetical protein